MPPCLYPPRVHPVPPDPAKGYIRRGAHARERGRARRQQHYSGGDLASPLQMLGLAWPRQHKAGPGRAGPKRERGWYGGGRQGKDGQRVRRGERVRGAVVTGSCWVGDTSVALWHPLALPQGCPEPGVPPALHQHHHVSSFAHLPQKQPRGRPTTAATAARTLVGTRHGAGTEPTTTPPRSTKEGRRSHPPPVPRGDR